MSDIDWSNLNDTVLEQLGDAILSHLNDTILSSLNYTVLETYSGSQTGNGGDSLTEDLNVYYNVSLP
jgi:hypothetical protein